MDIFKKGVNQLRHKCDVCGYQRISYNSCRDRHCPKYPDKSGPERNG